MMSESPSKIERILNLSRRALSSVRLRQRQIEYHLGQIETRDSFIESRFSWIWRSFGRDRYVYLVTEIPYKRDSIYIIERVEQLSFLNRPLDGESLGYSGAYDEHSGMQRNPLYSFNDGDYGERSALTIYGTWITSYPHAGWYQQGLHESTEELEEPMEQSMEELMEEIMKEPIEELVEVEPDDPSLPPLGSPFSGVSLPAELRIFQSEQAAYSYLPNVNGEKIPPQIKHIAWVAIGVSTIIWQWHDEIGNWIVTLVDRLSG